MRGRRVACATLHHYSGFDANRLTLDVGGNGAAAANPITECWSAPSWLLGVQLRACAQRVSSSSVGRTMNDFVALIAAGGRATRMREDGRPKSLIPIDGSCLLRACITNTQAVGCQRILVTTNRPDWAPAYEEICYGFQDVVLNFDDGYGSTFLLNQALIDQMAPTYLFQYGHAPRSTEELGELLTLPTTPACAVYSSSSRREPIPSGRSFIEPPFLLDRKHIANSAAQTWKDYFLSSNRQPRLAPTGAPREANTRSELDVYVAYYRGTRARLA